ncbi:MAG: hypothetical protein N2515_05770, partial [Deltaproteobacteria bacterium]|nr:hypothetical protein [Deltaproteobacteria bacterium]
FGIPSKGLAVRPFVTDDARIVDTGQLEFESWPDLAISQGAFDYAYYLMFGVTPIDWLEIITGGGVGRSSDPSSGRIAIPNPVLQFKLLFWKAEENGVPGLAFDLGFMMPFGAGSMFDPAFGWYAYFVMTTRLWKDWVMIHWNGGARGSVLIEEREGVGSPGHLLVRPFWGLGVDMGFFDVDVRLILEAFGGDPFDLLGPDYSFQWGFRWLATDHLNLDLTFGAQPTFEDRRQVGQEWDAWVQTGVRITVDAFVPGGRKGDPTGARGIVPAYGSPPWSP